MTLSPYLISLYGHRYVALAESPMEALIKVRDSKNVYPLPPDIEYGGYATQIRESSIGAGLKHFFKEYFFITLDNSYIRNGHEFFIKAKEPREAILKLLALKRAVDKEGLTLDYFKTHPAKDAKIAKRWIPSRVRPNSKEMDIL